MKYILNYFFKSSLPQNAQDRGVWAEDQCTYYLQRRGWRICARNWIGGGGELDVVCSRWSRLLIAEVRFRAHDQPFASIDDVKIAHLQSSTRALIHTHKLHKYHVQFDAFGVFADGHIERRQHICTLK